MNKLGLFFLGLALMTIACKEIKDPAKQAAEFEKTLSGLDKEMSGPNGVITDKTKAQTFIATAEQYAALVEISDLNKSIDLQLKAAGLAKTIDNPKKALELYENVAKKYPQHEKAPMSLFMSAFVYENDLNDLVKAKYAYESFLKTYPNDPDFSDDAQTALQMLGKSPEEIIKTFEGQNKAK
jgi:tetratricopeptide (TPR) repeat protein